MSLLYFLALEEIFYFIFCVRHSVTKLVDFVENLLFTLYIKGLANDVSRIEIL